ncbi:gamma-glutamyl-hercynylcysteine sulfoxide hydrolase [Lentzea sp. NBRC 105346]|uniref:ergothioneine biosynthesis protein EgtC n=1 Tax=Lentzea sp. NBRC 105346 TaxID=3032205 RepID=UPI0024A361CC|nr:ergothioneine biosynthesis protein EgtC [Lentzea sp. NBRC 105346]GLZ33552.1 gamma-glutamyl-hercynylcysteine sulfoxide hydrolase [Lentzea sp. NBRC 105346]
MCRHLGYLGPAVPLAELLFDRPHSLERQSHAPKDMRGGGTINVDGYGVGWFPGPVRYRRAGQIWSDGNLRALARSTSSGAVLAAVRSATAGMPVVDQACAPFTDGRWLFSLNGRIDGWPDTVADLASSVPVTSLLCMDAPTDAALLWTVLRHRLDAGDEPDKAVAALVNEVSSAAPNSRLNLMLTDGVTLVGTTWTHALWVLEKAQSVTLASEPLDDDAGWREVPDRSVVTAGINPSTVEVQPI